MTKWALKGRVGCGLLDKGSLVAPGLNRVLACVGDVGGASLNVGALVRIVGRWSALSTVMNTA